MNLKTVTIADLEPHPENPNTHPAKQIDALGDSLDEFDQVKNVVIWRGLMLAGHAVREAAIKSGRLTLEAVDVSHWDEAKAKAFMLADIRLPDMGIYDEAAMAEALRHIDEPLDIPGFDEDFLAKIGLEVEEPKEPVAPQIDKAEELRQEWGTAVGQLWALGEHRLAVGDCTDREVVERVMGRGNNAAACITDPPYGQNFDVNYTRFSGGLSRSRNFGTGIINDDKPFDPKHLLDYPVVILWGANYYAKKLSVGSWLVWDKRYKEQEKILSDGEIGWVNKGVGVYIFTHGWNGFLKESERGKTLHPTQKPVALFEWCIKNWAKNCEVIFDPYCGSGPVFSACENLNRRCRGIEIDPGYAAVTLQRFLDHTDIKPELIK